MTATRIEVKGIDARLDALEAARASDRADAAREIGRLKSMLFSLIAEVAKVQEHVDMPRPRRKAPPGLPLKTFAIDSGWSESGLRRRAAEAKAAGCAFAKKIGDRWFVIPELAPTKRKYRRRESSD